MPGRFKNKYIGLEWTPAAAGGDAGQLQRRIKVLEEDLSTLQGEVNRLTTENQKLSQDYLRVSEQWFEAITEVVKLYDRVLTITNRNREVRDELMAEPPEGFAPERLRQLADQLETIAFRYTYEGDEDDAENP